MSLAPFAGHRPVPVNTPSLASLVSSEALADPDFDGAKFTPKSLSTWKGMRRAGSFYASDENYIEAQVHGGVGAADIAGVIFHGAAGHRFSKELRQWLIANKIPFVVRDD